MSEKNFYVSGENFWKGTREKHGEMATALQKMEEINQEFCKARTDLEHDKYGLMGTMYFESQYDEIQKIKNTNQIQFNYIDYMHKNLKDTEFNFYKGLNKVMERLSMIDIEKYTVKNTLGIEEIYQYQSMDKYEEGDYTNYTHEISRVKNKINIVDITMNTEIMSLQEQFEAYLNQEGIEYEGYELQELKKQFYAYNLGTAFNHEAYASGFTKALSKTLDFIPFIGGLKGIIEGIAGQTMTGELLTDNQRGMMIGMGVFSLGLDIVLLGAGAPFGDGAKAVVSYFVKATIPRVAVGWTFELGNQALRNMGLTPEEIFVINIIATLAYVYVNKKIHDSKNPKIIKTETHNSWEGMKEAHPREVTKFLKNNKPPGSPVPRNWFDKGGTLVIETLSDGKTTVWTYYMPGKNPVKYIPQMLSNGQVYNIVEFSSKDLHPDKLLQKIDTVPYSGNRAVDDANVLKYLKDIEYEGGFPKGYVLHHAIVDGEFVFQFVKQSAHGISHYGGFYYYNLLMEAMGGK